MRTSASRHMAWPVGHRATVGRIFIRVGGYLTRVILPGEKALNCRQIQFKKYIGPVH